MTRTLDSIKVGEKGTLIEIAKIVKEILTAIRSQMITIINPMVKVEARDIQKERVMKAKKALMKNNLTLICNLPLKLEPMEEELGLLEEEVEVEVEVVGDLDIESYPCINLL